jgi:hypothetical protein
MLVTNHVLSGALIGAVVRRPVPAFVLGVASHFVLDAVPHWGQWRDHRQFMRVAVPDGLTGLAAIAAFAGTAPRGRRAAVAAGMLGAALPDIDKPSKVWFGFSPWPSAVDDFHRRIQDEAADRFVNEAVSAAFFAASALLALRSRATPRRPHGVPYRAPYLPAAAADGAAVSGPGGRVPPGSVSLKPEPASPVSGRRG